MIQRSFAVSLALLFTACLDLDEDSYVFKAAGLGGGSFGFGGEEQEVQPADWARRSGRPPALTRLLPLSPP
jgi:hypothetical protein